MRGKRKKKTQKAGFIALSSEIKPQEPSAYITMNELIIGATIAAFIIAGLVSIIYGPKL